MLGQDKAWVGVGTREFGTIIFVAKYFGRSCSFGLCVLWTLYYSALNSSKTVKRCLLPDLMSFKRGALQVTGIIPQLGHQHMGYEELPC